MPSWQLNQSQLDYRGSASVLGPAAGRLTAARTSERQRLELLVGEIDRRFPGLLAVLTAEHVAALPAHLVAHYRPGVDWRFVLPALHDAWTETLERLAERAADVAERR